jgi:protein-tyrosine phosphatase
VDLVIDLTAEFTEPACVRAGRQYVCLPTLDASVPDDDGQVLALADMLVEYPGTIYVHCAEGHGRAATVAAFVLLAKGLARDADEALALVKAARPKTNPRPWQRSRLRHWEELFRQRQAAAKTSERET